MLVYTLLSLAAVDKLAPSLTYLGALISPECVWIPRCESEIAILGQTPGRCPSSELTPEILIRKPHHKMVPKRSRTLADADAHRTWMSRTYPWQDLPIPR